MFQYIERSSQLLMKDDLQNHSRRFQPLKTIPMNPKNHPAASNH